MSELMALNGANEVLIMSSLEIADLTGKSHNHVLRDIRNIERSLSGESRVGFVERFNNLGFKVKDSVYYLNKRDTFLLMSGYSVELRARIIDRWQELEEQVRKPALPDFTNPVVAARAWADEVEQKLLAQKEAERLALENKELAPKAAVCDAIVRNEHHRNATQVAKPLGMTAAQLNKKLEQVDVYDTRIKRGGRMFRQWFVDKGYGVVKCSPEGYVQSLFTAKGQLWVSELFACK